jgi:murein DD-endopeptidase MepM/ murein hydrolase activator NlpD
MEMAKGRRPAVLSAVAGVLFFMALFPASAENEAGIFPEIEKLNRRDEIFRQFEDDVREGRRVFTSRGQAAPWAERLAIYVYQPGDDGEDADNNLQGIAARTVLPASSIASLNRIARVSDPLDGPPPSAGVAARELYANKLFPPTVPGIFLPAEPASDMEKLLASTRDRSLGVELSIAGQKWTFFPGDDWTGNERAFFLSSVPFRFPLRSWTLTSGYGSRVNPVSGKPGFHKGLDLAAPAGAEVFAAADAAVKQCSSNAVYGSYVILEHSGGWTSLYGHLSQTLVKPGQKLKAGSLVGRVGSTGQSTGPHLHFELARSGKAEDPSKLLDKGGR